MAKETGTILLLGGAAVAIYGYFQGWFSGLTTKTAPSPAPPPTTTAPGTTGGPANTVPPMGTVVVSVPQALAQVAAKDAYVMPNMDVYVALQTQIPANSGYNFYVDSNGVPLLLRDDVYNALQASPAGAAGTVSLADIKKVMVTQGLSGCTRYGLGDYQRYLTTRGYPAYRVN